MKKKQHNLVACYVYSGWSLKYMAVALYFNWVEKREVASIYDKSNEYEAQGINDVKFPQY